jgi:hypothetical protein
MEPAAARLDLGFWVIQVKGCRSAVVNLWWWAVRRGGGRGRSSTSKRWTTATRILSRN